MFKKNNKSVLNPSLPSSQIRSLVPTLMPLSMPSVTKGSSITKQLLAKYENKYISKVKTAESTDSDDISDAEPSAEKATIEEVEEDINKVTNENVDEEAIYESDFETSDSDESDNETSTAISQTHFRDKNSILPTDIDEISEVSIHENFLTFEELKKINGNQIESPTIHMINSEQGEISECLETEIEEISTPTKHSKQQPLEPQLEPNFPQNKNQEIKSTSQVLLNDNIVSFSEMLSRNENALEASGYHINKENVVIDAEPIKELKTESTKQTKDNCLNKLEGSVKEMYSAKHLASDKEGEQILHKEISSPSKTNITFTAPTENAPRVTELSSKPKSKRKSDRQSLEERRRLERMFFLVEKQSLKGVVDQPVFKPLAMSWEREAETTVGPLDSQLATPEDAFAEMLRLRLRLTRDKMAAEYSAYRSCCAATQILASSHQPVTLAATRQIISQLKRPDHPDKES